MLSDKEIKKEILEKARKEPEKYYPAELLESLGFHRHVCKFCGRGFWSKVDRDYCDEPECRLKAGEKPYGFIGRGGEMSYEKAWQKWKEIFSSMGHTVINRYPVVARWRDDAFFVQASIYDFQPHVVSGEVEPPANPLLVPQFCVRFNDVENVGISGRHYTGFVMVGQHAFNYPGKKVYFKDKGLYYIHEFLRKGLKLRDDEILFHEDAWAGGGNFGVSMEFFSQGLEIGNQVYMEYQLTADGIRELKTKVIDMGAGLERHPWIVEGKPTSYEIVFAKSFKHMRRVLGIEYNASFWSEFGRYSGILDVDEGNIEESWKEVSRLTGYSREEIMGQIRSVSALFSILDHIRTLWVAVNDGALPSNVGGGYNLRYILRRVFNISSRNAWDIDFADLLDSLSKDLSLFPELRETRELVEDVIRVEKKKHEKAISKGMSVVLRMLEKKERLGYEDLKKLYESHGILPEMVEEIAREKGIEVEKGFYARMAEERKEEKRERKALPDVSGFPPTEKLFYTSIECYAKVLGAIRDKRGWWIILDRTCFYPEMGGQEADRGTIAGKRVLDVQKAGNVILHLMEERVEGEVHCKVDWERRKRLMQHHTATHIIGLSARKILGKHIFQAGTHKYPEKAHIDVTHYKDISEEEWESIEEFANRIVREDYPVTVEELPRTEAERKYGMRIYQGGAPPGKVLRIVSIDNLDHQACGGTHVSRTSEVEDIFIFSITKVQDGRIRIEYSAGDAAKALRKKYREMFERLKGSASLFSEWKEKRKRLESLLKKYASMVEGNVVVQYLPLDYEDIEFLAREMQDGKRLVVLFSSDRKFIVSAGKESGRDAREVASAIHELMGGKSGGSKEVVRGFVERLDDSLLGDINERIS